MLLICRERDNVSPNITLMFLALVLIFIDSSPMFIVVICWTFLNVDFDPINITSVFDSLSLTCLIFIHSLTSAIQAFIFLMVISELFGSKESNSCVSSAYVCIWISCFRGIWYKGAVYTGYENGPRTDS